MVLFNSSPYKRMRLTSKVSLTKRFSEKYKRMRLITRLYDMPINTYVCTYVHSYCILPVNSRTSGNCRSCMVT